ncbi:hypothetical protein ACOMHN_003987 [Nucella lapillus]
MVCRRVSFSEGPGFTSTSPQQCKKTPRYKYASSKPTVTPSHRLESFNVRRNIDFLYIALRPMNARKTGRNPPQMALKPRATSGMMTSNQSLGSGNGSGMRN